MLGDLAPSCTCATLSAPHLHPFLASDQLQRGPLEGKPCTCNACALHRALERALSRSNFPLAALQNNPNTRTTYGTPYRRHPHFFACCCVFLVSGLKHSTHEGGQTTGGGAGSHPCSLSTLKLRHVQCIFYSAQSRSIRHPLNSTGCQVLWQIQPKGAHKGGGGDWDSACHGVGGPQLWLRYLFWLDWQPSTRMSRQGEKHTARPSLLFYALLADFQGGREAVA